MMNWGRCEQTSSKLARERPAKQPLFLPLISQEWRLQLKFRLKRRRRLRKRSSRSRRPNNKQLPRHANRRWSRWIVTEVLSCLQLRLKLSKTRGPKVYFPRHNSSWTKSMTTSSIWTRWRFTPRSWLCETSNLRRTNNWKPNGSMNKNALT